MKNLLTLSVIFLLFTAFTRIDSGIDGTWKATVEGPNGSMEITYNFNVDGDTLTGTVVTSMGQNEILNGQVDGKEFSFQTSVNNNFTITHKCVLKDENTIDMKFSFGQQEPQSLTLTRVTEEED